MVFVALPSAYRAPESFAGSSSIIIMPTTIETRHSPNETTNTEHKNRTIYFPTLDYIPVPENKNVRFWFSYINTYIPTYINTYMHVGISISILCFILVDYNTYALCLVSEHGRNKRNWELVHQTSLPVLVLECALHCCQSVPVGPKSLHHPCNPTLEGAFWHKHRFLPAKHKTMSNITTQSLLLQYNTQQFRITSIAMVA